MSIKNSKNNKVSIRIVVPCFNEATRLPVRKLTEFIEAHPNIGFILVNDGSKDQTLYILKDIKSTAPQRIDVLNFTINQGKAEAVRQGFIHAFRSGIDMIGYWDADLSTPLSAIFEYIEVFNENPSVKWVFGSRVRLLGRKIERSTIRHYIGRISATTISVVLNLPIYDTQCGAKLFKVDESLPLIFKDKFISRWIFEVELIARLKAHLRDSSLPVKIIYEHPLMEWAETAGSKLKATDYFKALLELIQIWRFQKRNN